MQQKILITSATGKTGFHAAKALLEKGLAVRIFVRNKNGKAMELERAGAEIATGELSNAAQLRSALDGVQKVYYCYPMMKGMPESVALFIAAAKELQIETVVLWASGWRNFPISKAC